MSDVASQVLKDTRCSIVENGLFSVVQTLITSDCTVTDAFALASAAVIHTPGAVWPFINQIATIPALPDKLCTVDLFPLDSVVAAISNCDSAFRFTDGIDCESIVYLLSNILAFGHSRLLSTSASSSVASFIHSLSILMASIPLEYFSFIDPSQSIDEDEEEELSTIKASLSFSIDPNNVRFIKLLADSNVVLRVLRLGFSHSEHFPWAIQFIASITAVLPNQRDNLLNLLVFTHQGKVVQELFNYISHCRLWKLALDNFGFESLIDASLAADWCAMVVFMELFARLLLVVGDDELFHPDFAVNTISLSNLCVALKNMAVQLAWNGASSTAKCLSSPILTINHVQKLIFELLKQLYSRNSRRPFCSEDLWLMSTDIIRPEAFVEAATSDTSVRLPQATGTRSNTCRTILQDIPFVIPFESRVSIFCKWVEAERLNSSSGRSYRPVARVTIRRGQVFEDGFAYLNALGPSLKGRISISFIDEHGLHEAGIDGGGVFKEFMTQCLKQAFNANYGLFETTKDQLLYPSPRAYAMEEGQLKLMEFLGRIIGKALFEGVLIDAAFAKFFLAKWLGKRSYLDDLPSLDPELYAGLIYLKNYTGDVEKDFSLNFTISEQEFGVLGDVQLIPHGSNVPVTSENRIRYIFLMANYKLNKRIALQCQAFFRGLSDLINPQWLKMFNESELQILLGGHAVPIDLNDLKANTIYDDVYGPEHPTIVILWQVLESFSDETRRQFVKFVTSCSRPPLLGFKELSPKLCIRMAGNEADRLPSASTCVNLLKLPAYTSRSVLYEKLVYAITSESGFGLS